MRRPLVDFLDRLQRVSSEADLKAAISRWARELGFQHAAYGNAMVKTGALRIFTGSYPNVWVERYEDAKYLAVDPVVRTSLKGVLPFKWGHKEQRKGFNPVEAQFFDEADDFGISRGFSVPVHGPGGELSVLTVATDEMDSGFHKLIDLYGDVLHLGCCYIHQRMGNVVARDEEEPQALLSGREAECLLWTSSGKTASEVGDILRLSDSTVVYHLENAKRKLGARTKSHAVAKAHALGLLACV